MKRIARVFPTKTNMSPDDPDAYFSHPHLNTPFYDEVHISCTFTWDIEKAKNLAIQWRKNGKIIKVGGVAIDGESNQPFQAGMYLKRGITITSRGCVNNCSFCMVRRGLIEFDEFSEGNIIQDNNILGCSDRHWNLVLSMLKKQKRIEFKGGLDKFRVTSKIAEDLRGLRINALWLACDQPQGIEPLRKAVEVLKRAGFTRSHLYCYVLIGNDARENIQRLKEVWRMGCMPFAQLLRQADDSIKYTKSWKRFQRRWSKPMIIRSRNHSFSF